VKRGRKIPENARLVGDTTSMDEAPTKDTSYIEDEAVSLGWHIMSLLISFLPASIVILNSICAIYVTSLHGFFGALIGLYPFVLTIAQILAALCMMPLRKVLHGGGKAKTGESLRVYSKTFMKHMLAKSLYHSTLRYGQGTLVSRLVSKYIYGADIDVHASYLPFVEEPDLTKIGKNVFGANGESSSLYKKVHIICTYHPRYHSSISSHLSLT